MEKGQISGPVPMEKDGSSFQNGGGPSFFEQPAQSQFDQRRPQSIDGMETGLNSAATSIHNGIEKHDADFNHIDINDPNRPRFGIRKRLAHFTWAWYTFPMSTGGLSLLIFAQPHISAQIRPLGLVVYILNLILFTCITCAMLTRFVLHRGTLTKSLSHEREGFFFPTFFLSIATIITSTQRYAIPDNDIALTWAIKTAFWGYVLVTLVLAVGQYSYVFAAHSFGLQTMMPTWILPIFPIMLSGTIASVIASTQPAIDAIPIIAGGLTCQGLGISVSFMMYAHMVGRLMQAGECKTLLALSGYATFW